MKSLSGEPGRRFLDNRVEVTENIVRNNARRSDGVFLAPEREREKKNVAALDANGGSQRLDEDADLYMENQ